MGCCKQIKNIKISGFKGFLLIFIILFPRISSAEICRFNLFDELYEERTVSSDLYLLKINNAGESIASQARSNFNLAVFITKDLQQIPLFSAPGDEIFTSPVDINDNGDVLINYSSQFENFEENPSDINFSSVLLWTKSGGLQDLNEIIPGIPPRETLGQYVKAFAINNSQQMLIRVANETGETTYFWDGVTLHPYTNYTEGDGEFASSIAPIMTSLNDNGQAAGIWIIDDTFSLLKGVGARWDSPGDPTEIYSEKSMVLPFDNMPGKATAINNSGDVVGYTGEPRSSRIEDAFAWKNGSPLSQPLTKPDDAQFYVTAAYGINNEGYVAGGDNRGFIWQPNGDLIDVDSILASSCVEHQGVGQGVGAFADINNQKAFIYQNKIFRPALPSINMNVSADWFPREKNSIGDRFLANITLTNTGIVELKNFQFEITGGEDIVRFVNPNQPLPETLAAETSSETILFILRGIAPGTREITFKVTAEDNQGRKTSFSRIGEITVAEPENQVDVSIIIPDAGKQLNPTETTNVTLKIASTLDEVVTVNFIGTPIDNKSPTVVKLEPTETVPASFTLAENEVRTFQYTATAIDGGIAIMDSTIEVVKSDLSTSSSSTKAQISVPALDVEVIPLETEDGTKVLKQFILGQELKDDEFYVRVRVTNKTKKTVSNISIDDLDIGNTAEDRHNSTIIVIPDSSIGELTPKGTVGDTGFITYKLKGLFPGTSSLTAKAIGFIDGERVNDSGVGEIKIIKEPTLKFDVKRTDGKTLSGSSLLLEGYLENQSETTVYGVVVYHIPSGNAGRGVLFDEKQGIPAVQGSAIQCSQRQFPVRPDNDPSDAYQGFIIKPADEDVPGQERVNLIGLISTLCWPDISTASVKYIVSAFSLKTDEDGNLEYDVNGVPIRIAEVSDQVIIENDTITAELAANAPKPDDGFLDCGIFSWGCATLLGLEGFWDGLMQFGPFIAQVTKQDLNYGYRLLAYVADMAGVAREALLQDPNAQAKLVAEWNLNLKALLDAGVITSFQVEALEQDAVAKVAGFLQNVTEGNYKTAGNQLFYLAGSSPDSILETSLVRSAASRLMRGISRVEGSSVVNTVRRHLKDLDEASDVAEVNARYQSASKLGKDIPTEVAKAGDKLSRQSIRDYWGASLENIQFLENFSRELGIAISFRSRSIKALGLLRDGLAYVKPEFMKIKGVIDTDIKYLDYPSFRRNPKTGVVDLPTEGTVHFVEPPVLKSDFPDTKSFNKGLDDWMSKRHPDIAKADDLDLYHDIRERADLRAREWEEFNAPDKLPQWTKKLADGGGVDTGFNYVAQGIPKVFERIFKGKTGRRGLKKTATPDFVDGTGKTRKAFELDIDGLDGFKPFTGDIDFISILNLDGTFILNPLKRIFIYKELAKRLGMQHGESFSFSLKAKLRAVFLEPHVFGVDGAEGVVSISGQEKRVGFFAKNRTILPEIRNGAAIFQPEGDLILLTGRKQALVAEKAIFNRVVRQNLSDNIAAFYLQLGAVLWPISIIDRVVDGVELKDISDKYYDRPEAQIIQPDNGEFSRGDTNARLSEINKVVNNGLKVWKPDSGWQGISIADARNSERLIQSLPMSSIIEYVKAGEDEVQIATLEEMSMSPESVFFEKGNLLVIGPGLQQQEYVVVETVSPLRFKTALTMDHFAGTMIARVPDSDGDGVEDPIDSFPDNPQESLDTDNDGIGNNQDDDDDGDGFSDDDEIFYGTDPLDENDSPDTHRPSQPDLVSIIADEATPFSSFIVDVSAFIDPDEEGDASLIEAQIMGPVDDSLLGSVFLSNVLLIENELALPYSLLDPARNYQISFRYTDASGLTSDFSESKVLPVNEIDAEDQNQNGIMDSAEISEYTDLNKNGVIDVEENIKVFANSVNSRAIGIETSSGTVNRLKTLDDADFASDDGKDYFLGMFAFRVDGIKTGSEIQLTYYLSEFVGGVLGWSVFDPNNGILEASDRAEFSNNSILVSISDGGQGDLDGVANGRVVVQAGPYAVPTSSDSKCFISTAVFGKHAPQTNTLRAFRDKFLLTNELGTEFVAWYYQNSPSWVVWVEDKPWAQQTARMALAPAVLFSEVALGERYDLLLWMYSILFLIWLKKKKALAIVRI